MESAETSSPPTKDGVVETTAAMAATDVATATSMEENYVHPSRCAMNEWFRNASPEECDAMTAIQLDYRFVGDDFRIEWWVHAEALGFARVDYYHYRLPSGFDKLCRDITSGGDVASGVGNETIPKDGMVHTSKTLCAKLNALAIPQGRSVFDRIGDGGNDDMLQKEISQNRILNTACTKDDIVDQWTTVREELIFRKFHEEITKECRNRVKRNQKKSKGVNQTKRKLRKRKKPDQKQKLWSSADAGTELFFNKGKRGRGNRMGKDLSGNSKKNDTTIQNLLDSASIDYPTTKQAYERCAQTQRLNEIASVREKCIADSSFEEWKFLLSTNHSLLVYGVGSKKNLLGSFANHNIEGDIVEIDGFDNSVTVDGILQLLIDQWLDGKEPTIRKRNLFHVHFEKNNTTNRSNTAERIAPFFPRHGDFYTVQKAVTVAKQISLHVMKTSRPITLVVHNIDGVGLCSHVAQEALAALVSLSRTDCGLNSIRLVASVDHFNGEIFTESHSRHRLNWLRKEVHTHRPYKDEVLHDQAFGFENDSSSSDKRASKSIHASTDRGGRLQNDWTEEDHLLMEHESIFSVLKSLASTHAESLRQLAWLQLETDQEWVSYTDLLNRCRSERIVQADQQFRLYLGELLDHNILERNKKKTGSSTISYRIPYSEEILSLIWNYKTDR